jgi:hypothetical protein
VKSTTEMPSLLPYLEPTGAKFYLRLSLLSKEPSIQERSPSPFLSISESDPFARLIQAQFVTDAGSEIKRVFLLLQRDEYPLSKDTLSPISNHDIDERWQKTFSFYSDKKQDSSVVILANQIRKDGGLSPLQSLFYCKPKQIFFHPPCPRCGLPLQQCYDDHVLMSLGLQPYSTSLMRYLFCPACFESWGQSDFFAYSLKGSNSPILKDRWNLITEFGQLTEGGKPSSKFPCSHCPSWQECYGAEGLAISRIIPFSFYPFFMLIFLRKDIKDTLFQQRFTAAQAETLPENEAIHEILSKLIEKWSVGFETKEEELEKTVVVSATGGEKLEEAVVVSQVDRDIQETVILRSQDFGKEISPPVQKKEEDIPETVVIAPSEKPSTSFSSSRRLPPKGIEIDKDVKNLEQRLERTGDIKKRVDESEGDGFLDETVILRPDKPKK